MSEQALVVADRQGVVRYWNTQATTFFGHSEAAAVGSSLDIIVPEEFRARHWTGFHRAWKQGIDDNPRVAILPVLCADGYVRRFPARLLPMKGPRGDLVAIAGIYSEPNADRDANLFVMR